MEKAIVSLSFDDARGDNSVIFDDILIPKGIHATLNVTTGYVDGTCPHEKLPSEQVPMSITDIQRFFKSGYIEMALHGDTHDNTELDMRLCHEKLSGWLGTEQDYLFGMASPGSGMSIDNFIYSDNDFFRNQIAYLRTGLRINKKAFLRVLSRKIGRVWHRPEFYQIAYQDTIMYECTDRVIYAVPVMGDISLQQICSIVRYAASCRGAICLMFHSIGSNFDKDPWTWSREKFNGLCNLLIELEQREIIEIKTTMDLYRTLASELSV